MRTGGPWEARSSHGAKISEKRAIPVTRDPPIENPPNLAPSPTTNRQTDFHPYQVHSTPPPLCPIDKTNPVSRKTPFPWSKTHQTWHRDRHTDRQTPLPRAYPSSSPGALSEPKNRAIPKPGFPSTKPPQTWHNPRRQTDRQILNLC